jgi:hypothetical protein
VNIVGKTFTLPPKTFDMANELMPFEGKEIRKVWQDEQCFFSVVDVIGILTESL